jgi:hypothetical protein
MSLGRRSFLVSHSKFVSIYDLIKNEWVQHVQFEHKVKALRRNCEDDGNRRIYVILDNGIIKMIEIQSKSVLKEWAPVEDKTFSYLGRMQQICSDFVDICTHCMKTYDEQTKEHHLYYFFRGQVEKQNIPVFGKFYYRRDSYNFYKHILDVLKYSGRCAYWIQGRP